ncbi:MAG TPA: hypothetical protein PKD51_10480 [Saprospiraceae bacterium]|nr:hypothetical protein [Saprospiraceae bacterium]
MEYNKFERQIANTLRQDEVGLDINALIDGIHGNKKKDRKWMLLWFFVIGSIFIASGLMYMSSGQLQSKSIVNVKENSKSVPTKESNQSESEIIEIQNINTNINPENKQFTSSLDNQADYNTKGLAKTKSLYKKVISQSLTQTKTLALNQISKEALVEKQTTSFDVQASESNNTRNINNISLLSNLSANVLFDRPKVVTDKVVCPTFSSRHKWYIELIPEIGYFRPLKTLENTTGEQNSVFDLRNKNEKTLEGIQAALYLQLRKQKSPLYLKAGLSYARLTEKMQLDYSYTKLDTSRGIISVTVSQTGDTVTTIIGDIVTEKTLSGKKVAHHSFSLYDIPIAIGYEKKMGPWSFGIEGGVMLNLSMQASGSTLFSDTSFVSVDASPNQYRTNVGLSYFGGLNVGRDFHRIGRIYLAARARFIPATFTTDAQRFRQSYNFAGLHLGYVYTF